MEVSRRRFQGVLNVLRFNRHQYLMGVLVSGGFLFFSVVAGPLSTMFLVLGILGIVAMLASVIATLWAYDLSGIYGLGWLKPHLEGTEGRVISIHAGFDEMSPLIKNGFPHLKLETWDLYDEQKQTERSIRIARKEREGPQALKVSFDNLPGRGGDIAVVLLLFSVHELRAEEDRTTLFKQVNKIIQDDGKIILMEHLRDLPNFLAYSFGFLHFHGRRSWEKSISMSGLKVSKSDKISPFINIFILERHGVAF